MSQTELACKDIVFHFNKAHLADPKIPTWVIKAKGTTYYVDHVDCKCPWSTKETPENSHTKGSIKIKDCLLVITDDNTATITPITDDDLRRLRNEKRGITRIIFKYASEIHNALKNNEFKHSPFKNVTGECGTSYVVCDLLDKVEVTFAALKYQFRILASNEGYYKAYDSKSEEVIWEGYEEELEDDEA